jgi:hypothetical protein
MRLTSLLGGLSLAAARAVAALGETNLHVQSVGPGADGRLAKSLGPITNSSSPVATASAELKCTGNCAVDGPDYSYITWVSGFPAPVVVATVIYIIDTGTNTTSTSTVLLDTSAILLSGRLEPPAPTNADGTAVTTITLSGTRTVVYVIQSCELSGYRI